MLQLAFFFFGLMFIFIGQQGQNVIGVVLLAATAIICLVNLFTIPGSVRKHREALRQKFSQELAAR